MSNVQVLPRFRVNDHVDMYADPSVCAELEGDEPAFVARTVVKGRYHIEALGWVYRLAGVSGLVEERWIQRHVSGAGGESPLGSIYQAVTQTEVQEATKEMKFAVGQVALTVDLEGMSLDDELVGIYVLIVGYGYFAGELRYICAIRHAKGAFLDTQEEFYEEELEAVSDAEVASLIKPASRPVLTVVHSS